MSADRSCIAIVATAAKADANKLWCAMGLDALPGNSFSAGLSAAGTFPATHWALHTWAEEAQANVFLALPTGVLPTISGAWADFGLTEETALAAAGALTVSVATGGVPGEHFAGILSGMGLQPVQRED